MGIINRAQEALVNMKAEAMEDVCMQAAKSAETFPDVAKDVLFYTPGDTADLLCGQKSVTEILQNKASRFADSARAFLQPSPKAELAAEYSSAPKVGVYETVETRVGVYINRAVDNGCFMTEHEVRNFPDSYTSYVVKKGDTLAGIAKEKGIPYNILETINRDTIQDPNKIDVGQTIKIPSWLKE